MASIQRYVVVVWLIALSLTCSPAGAQISRLPEDIQKRLAEINPPYQSNISKHGPETIRLFTPLVATGPKAGVTVTADQAYGADPEQTLDVYQPQGAGELPVVVLVHGGALTSGDKNENKEIWRTFCTTLLATAFWGSMPTIGWRRNMSTPPRRRT